MTNHVHLVVTPASKDALGRAMQFVGRFYVPCFNQRQELRTIRTQTMCDSRSGVLKPQAQSSFPPDP